MALQKTFHSSKFIIGLPGRLQNKNNSFKLFNLLSADWQYLYIFLKALLTLTDTSLVWEETKSFLHIKVHRLPSYSYQIKA